MNFYAELISVLKSYDGPLPITAETLSELIRSRNLHFYAVTAQTKELEKELKQLLFNVADLIGKKDLVQSISQNDGDLESLTVSIQELLMFVRDYLVDVEKERDSAKEHLEHAHQKICEIIERLEHVRKIFQSLDTMDLKKAQEEIRTVAKELAFSADLETLRRSVQVHLVSLHKLLNDHYKTQKEKMELLGNRLMHVHKGVLQAGEILREARKQIGIIPDLKETAYKDALTGIGNRRMMEEMLAYHISLSQRTGKPLSICIIDLDNFKQVNDCYGHESGDKCLMELAERISSILRTTDISTRYGGDEFVVILPDTPLESAKIVAERIRHRIEKTKFLLGEQEFRITASIGVGSYEGEDSWKEFFSRVDRMLYRAKSSGRNQSCFVLDTTANFEQQASIAV